MTDDLISRSALLEKATNVTKYDEGGWDMDLRAVQVEDIENAPAVDVDSEYKHSFEMIAAKYAKIQDKMLKGELVEVVRKPVVGYEGYYEVDRFGRVFGVDRTVSVNDNGRVYDKPLAGKQMKQSMHTKGYKTVSLTKDGKTKLCFVHRIVAEAFIPNPDNLPMVNHKDEDKTNNFLENLEWCTASYNRTYGKAIERHAKKIRGVPHSEEHKRKIGEGVRRSRGERRAEHED